MRYLEFGPYQLDPADHRLSRNGVSVLLPPKAFDTLVCLAQNSGRLVTRDELLKTVWRDSFVEDGSLSVSISQIRRALGEMEGGEQYIETVPRKGYRFRAAVTVVEQSLAARAVAAGNAANLRVGEISASAPSLLLKPESQLKAAMQTVAVQVPAAPGRSFYFNLRWFALVVFLVAALAIAWHYWPRSSDRLVMPFKSMRMTRLTSHGQVVDAAISPDGKYVAYILDELAGQSIWIRQVHTPSDLQRLPAEPGSHFGLTFSPDGNFLYYGNTSEAGARSLYRMPLLGGSATKIVSNITGPISFSPDGTRFAFVHMDPAKWQASLVIANVDGTQVTTVKTRTRPRYFSPDGIAWSSDARWLYCFAGNAAYYTDQAFRVYRVAVSGGAEEQVTSRSWAWGASIVRLPTFNSLLITAGDDPEGPLQIWTVSLPHGRVSRVTNDLNNYAKLSVAGDGATLAAVQTDQSVGLWLAPGREPDSAVPVSAENIERFRGLSWNPSNKSIVYSALAGDNNALFLADLDGHHVTQLTNEAHGEKEPVYTPDGRYVVYRSHGKIWRINRDGTNERQLTFGALDVHPSVSADGKYVIYASFDHWSPSIGGKPVLQKVPIDGGKPIQLADVSSSFPEESLDGKRIAAAYFPGGDPRFSESDIAIFLSRGGQPLSIFRRPVNALGDEVYWAPVRNAIDYIVSTGGVGNIWRQALSAGPPQQVTHFKTEGLFDFAWSRDGQELALARGKESRDVVLIRNRASDLPQNDSERLSLFDQ
jgi:Tol biopolymer transport system component/DNA-binding winged helix-turn-helix (wHTH) protein